MTEHQVLRAPLRSRAAPATRGAGWVGDGFRFFRHDWKAWLIISLLLVLIMIGFEKFPVFGIFAGHLVMPVFMGGLFLALHRIDEGNPGERLRVVDLFRGFQSHTGQLLLLGVIGLLLNVAALVAAIVALVTFAGADFLTKLAQSEDMMAAASELTFAMALMIGALLYLVILVPVVMLMWFAPALVAIEREDALSALRHSFTGCLRNLGAFTVYGVVGLLVFPLLVVVTLGLGILVLVPVGAGSIYAAYEDIFHRE